MKTIKNHWLSLLGAFCGGLVIAATALTAWSQTAPLLTITQTGTNQFSFSFTNYPVSTWDLQWTPALANTEFPWMWAATGAVGQTSFVLNKDDLNASPNAFFRLVLDTNSIPLWEAADPNNPSLGILQVTIDSPANGAVLQ